MNKTIHIFAIVAIGLLILISLAIRLAESLKNLVILLTRRLDNLSFSLVPDLEYAEATIK